ncbi:MAG: YbaK/EbsC family protein [Lactobacillus equicursoris]|uniref:YbaK/EbsC family protein n=1 Tax=Lactobacillus equicursoris TaxID=420645 RepID=UPI002430A2E7|nr:YbaK/EbsC family protein [Lactobacillus equicursoris]MDD6407689.1 YbaK/EbsC family protein [Lactobacillus equicursoris]
MAVDLVKDFFQDTDVDVIELPESSATVALAAQALKTEPDQIAKTLSYLVNDQPILIVMAGEARTDNRKYKETFHKKAKMIPFDQVEDYIGHAPGGVCPFAVKDNVKVYLDQSLKRHETVFPAAGSENSAVKLTIPQLEKYSSYEAWVDVTKTAE